ncbi:hypothetical protein ASF41_09730 [Methylobacterium sp. Leaf111]|uniref:O-antigen ligase family protein n=1 Tax=Methylobacterium sp. Leaf111 TaxID=1736257 RepID=UPI0006F5B4FA|nr:O-antigen ligase family protein [Methylobacterium sp. Leaf111]KQP59966.1 hypothetical protein ASF41_09730 [Methylobacterium sp. Leaf111]
MTGPAGPMAAGMRRTRAVPIMADRAAVFLLGVALQLNVLTSSFGLPFQRLSDLLPFLLIPWFGLRRAVIAEGLRQAVPMGAVGILIALSLVLKAEIQAGDVYLTLVLLLYFVLAMILLVMFRDRSLENAFCWGLLAGLGGSLVVLLLSSSGLPLDRFGLGVPTDGLDEELKLFVEDKQGGLWASGNETGHVFALGGAAALLLSLRYRLNLIYLAYFAALLASFPLTNNRSGLFMPVLILLVLMRRSIRLQVVLPVLGVLGILLVGFSMTGEIPLPQKLAQSIETRFAGDGNVSGNADERFISGFTALQLVAEYPFGVGETMRREELRALTGLVTPHNGFISLALQSGIATALLLLAALVRIARAPAAAGPFVAYTALFLVPSMMFEELSVNQYFLFFMAVLLASLVVRSGSEPATRR